MGKKKPKSKIQIWQRRPAPTEPTAMPQNILFGACLEDVLHLTHLAVRTSYSEPLRVRYRLQGMQGRGLPGNSKQLTENRANPSAKGQEPEDGKTVPKERHEGHQPAEEQLDKTQRAPHRQRWKKSPLPWGWSMHLEKRQAGGRERDSGRTGGSRRGGRGIGSGDYSRKRGGSGDYNRKRPQGRRRQQRSTSTSTTRRRPGPGATCRPQPQDPGRPRATSRVAAAQGAAGCV